MRNFYLLLFLLASTSLSSSTSIRTSLRSNALNAKDLLSEDPPATPPEEDEGSAEGEAAGAMEEAEDPLNTALDAVKVTEEQLDSVRNDLHGNVENIQEAAVTITDHARNVTDPEAYEKDQAAMEEGGISVQGANSSLPEARDRVVKAREEARRIELEQIRKRTEEQHKQEVAAAAAAAAANADAANAEGSEEGASGAAADTAEIDVNPDDENQPGEKPTIYANARVPLLKELVEATRDHTAQTTKYADLALELQKQRLAQEKTNVSMTMKKSDEDTEEDVAVMKEEAGESEEERLLLSPGRAQARAHCADPVLKVAGFKWCIALNQCLQTWEHECPGGEWSGAMKKEVDQLTSSLADLRRQKVKKSIEELRTKLETIKKVAGIEETPKSNRGRDELGGGGGGENKKGMMLEPRPAGPGEYGRLKGHVLQLRSQIEKYSEELKVPMPLDPYAAKHLPVPTEYQHGLPTPAGQSSQASQLGARLSHLVNEIATTKHRTAIQLMNREAEGVMNKLRVMTLGAHCVRCGKANCDVHERDALLWPALPESKKLQKELCSCHSLANPRCPCPKKSCAPPPPPPPPPSDCGCPKKKKTCECNDGNKPPPCGHKGEPKCVPAPVLCEDPGTPMHSVRLGQTYTQGSKLQFLCQPPYKLVGDEFRTCTKEARTSNTPTGDGNGGWRRAGDWTGVQPTCIPPECPKPRDDIDGVVTIGTDYRFPAKIEFKCEVGYTMEGVSSIQCLGTGQWNDMVPRCYPLQKPSAALSETFDKGKEEANELAKELGIESMSERDPTPEEKKVDEENKEKEVVEEMKDKSMKEKKEKEEKEEKKKEEEVLKKKALDMANAPENQPGSLEQLAHVAKHAQLELKRAEANRKDVEALVLANSASTSMAEAYGNTANLLAGTDPVAAEAAATKRAQIVKNLLEDGSPLYRNQEEVGGEGSGVETRGRAAASAASDVATKFVSDLLDDLAKSQASNPDNAEQDKAERKQVLAQASKSSSDAGYAEGTKTGIDDEASAIKVGKIAGAQAAAAVLAPILGLTTEEVLKNNQDKLETTLRRSMSETTGTPSSPSDLAASSVQSSIAAAEKMQNEAESKSKEMDNTKKKAVETLKQDIETKLEAAEKSSGGVDENGMAKELSKEEKMNAAIEGAESAVKKQIETMSSEGSDSSSSSSNSTKLVDAVTSSIADEAVANVLRTQKEAEEQAAVTALAAAASGGASSDDKGGQPPSTPGERIDAASEVAEEKTAEQQATQEEYDQKMAEHTQEVAEAEANVAAEKKTKEIVEKTKQVEEDNDEASLDGSINDVEQATPIQRR